MWFKRILFLLFASFLSFNLAFAKQAGNLQDLNASIERLVSSKDYTRALALCNAELQNSNSSANKRFLIVSKCRLFAKSRTSLDSIPILAQQQQRLYDNSSDSLELYLNARSLEIQGHYHFLSGRPDQSIVFLNSADSAYAITESYAPRIYNLNMLGTIYHLNEYLSKALLCQLLALDLLNEHNAHDTNSLIDLKIDVGLVYFKLEQYDKALEHYSDVMKLNLSSRQRAQVLNNLGIIFIEKQQYSLAKIHLLQALQVYQELGMENSASHTYNNLGSVIEDMNGDFDSIFYYFNKSLSIKKEGRDSAGMVSTYLNLSSFFFKRDKVETSEMYLDTAWGMQEHFMAQDLASAYFYKMRIARSRQQFEEALGYYETFRIYQDSANEIKNVWQLKKAEIELELSKQQQEIEILKKEKLIKDIADSRKNILIYSGVGISLVLIILLSLIAYYYYKRQRFEHSIRSREVKLASITNLVKGQEEERLRMAKELHDGVGNNLAILKAEMERDSSPDNQKRISSLLSSTSEEVRSITHDLMPITVKKLGLKEAIKDLVDKWRHSSSLLIDVNASHDDFGLAKDEELTIYRIIQELIKNSVQHGDATYILLNITKEDDKIKLQFEDNGHGIDDSQKSSSGTGIGFKNISNRVAYLNGTFEIDSDQNGVRMKFVFRKSNHENTAG